MKQFTWQNLHGKSYVSKPALTHSSDGEAEIFLPLISVDGKKYCVSIPWYIILKRRLHWQIKGREIWDGVQDLRVHMTERKERIVEHASCNVNKISYNFRRSCHWITPSPDY